MARPLVLSNGRMMVCLDEHGLVQDFYYPYVGQDNMISSRQIHHKLGVWVNGEFSWVDDGSWEISMVFADDALVGYTVYESRKFGLTLRMKNFVDCEEDIFGRILTFENSSNGPLEVRFFFHQVFQISRSGRNDTALYVPSTHPYIMTYRGNTTFISGIRSQIGESFDQYAIGGYMIEGKKGTFDDAEDGELSNNAVEHGGVDSVLRTVATLEPGQTWTVDYWVSASIESYHEATTIHRRLAVSGLSSYLERTLKYWHDWVGQSSEHLAKLDPRYRRFFTVSLLIVKAHIDESGGVLASGDSSIYNYNRDYYNYVWPRDAVYALLPLVRLGYSEEALGFLSYCQHVMHPRGYMHHKYQPDGAIGSTWHPMVQEGRPELNIQEDETAALILLFRKLIDVSEEHDKLDEIYNELIVPATEFISTYIDNTTGLPHASYDLWEEKFTTSTYTTTMVMQALEYAVELANMYDQSENAKHWQFSLDTLQKNFSKLFAVKEQYFCKGILLHNHIEVSMDSTLDASTFYALTRYEPLPLSDASVTATIMAAEKELVSQSPSGGMVRYQGDIYMLKDRSLVGNPWFICTFWLAQYYIKVNRMDDARIILDWAMRLALPSGVMSEQIDPVTGQFVGVAPLVWSHAELMNTVLNMSEIQKEPSKTAPDNTDSD